MVLEMQTDKNVGVRVFSREAELTGHMLPHKCVTGLGSHNCAGREVLPSAPCKQVNQEGGGIIQSLAESQEPEVPMVSGQTQSKGLRTIHVQGPNHCL